MRREEEERVRKEEEERCRQEEVERQAEEARRRKKERKKEKLQKKKQEGKYLTAKQKEEARRVEAMRKQFLAAMPDLALPIGGNTSGASTKRPIYQTKKSKQIQHHLSDTALVKVCYEGREKNRENIEEKRDNNKNSFIHAIDLYAYMLTSSSVTNC